MPSGGARKGAGRKPRPLAEKLQSGNPGGRPLKKIHFAGQGRVPMEPPPYLAEMKKKLRKGEVENKNLPSPVDIFYEAVAYLEPSECLDLISPQLIADYALAKYYLVYAQYELSQTVTVGTNNKGEVVVSSFAEAMLKMQKNVLATWEPIWDIVSRNSERLVVNPEEELLAMIMGGRKRRAKKEGNGDGEN